MSVIKINLKEGGRCEAVHEAYNSVIYTSSAIEFGGVAGEYSSTDLISAALGTCIRSSIYEILIREKIDLIHNHIKVTKKLRIKPKGIESLHVLIVIENKITEQVKKKIINAASTCVIKKSLNPDIIISVSVHSL